MSDLEKQLRRDWRTISAAGGAVERFKEAAQYAGLLDVAYASMDSPVGELLVAATPKGLVTIAFDHGNDDEVLRDLAARVSPRILEAPGRLDDVRRELDEYFEGRRKRFELKIDRRLIHGFHDAVLRQTSRIPYGQVSTYKQMAIKAGSPLAARAAGNALATNPIPIVIPCHRVLATGGGLGGYGGGLDNKRLLLTLEGATTAA